MSYIRCLSNPEGLYIIGTSEGVEIFGEKPIVMPAKDFNNLIKMYVKDRCNEDFQSGGIKLVYKRVPPFKDTVFGKMGNFKWVLTFKKRRVEMWDVTWNHIVCNNMRHICTKKQILEFLGIYK